jgi:GNAT superfamily N-acetyltransferase
VPLHTYEFDADRTERFLRFCRELHAHDPGWIPPFDETIRRQHGPAFPFYALPGARHRHFVVETGAGMRGHVLATIHPEMRDRDGTPVGALGFLECADDWPAADELLAAAAGWVRAHGACRRLWAPLNFEIWEAHRCMIRGFDESPFYGEPRNPPRYLEFLERFGFVRRRAWCSLVLGARGAAAAVVAPHENAWRMALAAGHRFTELTRESPPTDVLDLHGAVMRAFEGTLGYTPCPPAEYAALYASHASIVHPILSTLIRSPENATEGFAIAYPDVARAVRRADGSATRARQVICEQRATRIVFHSIGVVPEAQGHGLGSALMFETVRRALAGGYEDLVFALVANDSPGRRLVGEALRDAQREYGLFQLDL